MRDNLPVNELRDGDVFDGDDENKNYYRPTYIRSTDNGWGNCHEAGNVGEMYEDMGIEDPFLFFTSEFPIGSTTARIYVRDGDTYDFNDSFGEANMLALMAGYIAEDGRYADVNVSATTAPVEQQYFVLKAHFLAQCIAGQNVPVSNGGTEVRIVSNDGTEETISVLPKDENYEVGYGLGTRAANDRRDGSYFDCSTMARLMNQHADAAKAAVLAWIEANPDAQAPGDSVADPDADTGPHCEEAGGFAWVFCALLQGIDSALAWVQRNTEEILYVEPSQYEGTGMRNAWVIFRNISTVLLIIVLLVMVLSTSIGVGIFDAYTVKKLFPRLVAGIILMQLSWALMTFAISLVNTIGDGLFGLMLLPFGGPEATDLPSIVMGSGAEGGLGLFNSIVVAGIVSGGIALGFFGLVSLAFTTFLSVLIGFLVLVIRNMVIVLCLILAPVAIVAWITPGSTKGWNLWWDSFSKALLMFPLIMMLFAAGRILAYIAVGSNINEDLDIGALGSGAPLQMIIVIIAYAVPYFIIPFTLKFAGGLVASLGGIANDRGRGLFDRNKKFRQGQMAKNWQDTRNLHRFKGSGALSGATNKALGFGANLDRAGAKPWKWRGKMGALASGTSINQRDAMLEDDEYKRWKGNDDLNMYASMSTNERGLRKLLTESGMYDLSTADGKRNLELDISSAEGMRKKYGNAAFRQATWIQGMAGGTAFDIEKTQADGTKRTFNAWEQAADIAGSDGAIQAELVAKGRGVAGQAGRVDQGGISFGDGLGMVRQFRSDPNYTGDDARKYAAAQVYYRQGAGSLIHPAQKGSAVEAVAPAIVEDINNGLVGARMQYTDDAAGTPNGRTAAQKSNDARVDMIRRFASLKAVHENMGNTSPEKAKILRDRVMSQQVRVGDMSAEQRQIFDRALTTRDRQGNVISALSADDTITYSQMLEAIQGNSEFQQYRKEFETQFGAQQAAYMAQQHAAAQQQPGAGPQQGVPTGLNP